jgi:hypothetical protein
VAQRFTAAIKGLFSAPALAAEVTLRRGNHFFRKLFSHDEGMRLSTDPLPGKRPSFQSDVASDMISLATPDTHRACFHSSVAQWQSIRLLTGGL